MLNRIVGALEQVASQVGEIGGSVVGIRSGTEEPAFTVDRRIGGVEIRRYGTRIAAETAIAADEEPARNEGFRRLARYIFGGNTAKTKIAMTAPVAQQQGQKIAMTAPVVAQKTGAGEKNGADQWVIRFFMPSEHSMDSLPTPNDERVHLVAVPEETVAVLRFSGIASPETITERTGELLATLRAAGVDPAGDPMTWFYDPPWTLPFRRRNEIVVPVAG